MRLILNYYNILILNIRLSIILLLLFQLNCKDQNTFVIFDIKFTERSLKKNVSRDRSSLLNLLNGYTYIKHI